MVVRARRAEENIFFFLFSLVWGEERWRKKRRFGKLRRKKKGFVENVKKKKYFVLFEVFVLCGIWYFLEN